MSTFSLTRGSEAALGMLASQAGSETLLLTQPARELRAELSIEPFTSASGDQLLAVLFMREQRHSMTLQCNDGANVQHLADWVEAVANGTLDTAEAIPHRADPSDLAAATAAFHAAAHELNAKTDPAPAQYDQEAFEVEIPDIVAIYDGRHLLPYRSLEAGERLMTVAQHLRIEKQLRTAVARLAQPEQQPVAPTLTPAELEDLREFHEAVCCDAGHRVEKQGMRRLAEIGAVVAVGFGKHRLTEFGTYLLAAPIAQTAPQPDQSGLVEALKKRRIALTPEYEGQWHAELYASFEAPLFTAEGDTPEDAVEAVVRKAQADRATA